MTNRWIVPVTLVVVLVCSFTSSQALAKGDYHQGGLEKKFFHKAHFILDHQEELGLSQDTVDQIKQLKMDTKRVVIRKGAEKEIAWLDVREAMHEYPVDEERLVNLVQAKYAVKQEMSAALASSYAQVKNMLTEDQYEKMKELWKQS
jgi:Spy/CpxP family protein refolding chaperone